MNELADPAAKPAAPAAPCCCVIGDDTSAKCSFKDGSFLYFETPCKDFTMKIGGWAHLDNVWWNEGTALGQVQQSTVSTSASTGLTSAGLVRPGASQGLAGGVAGGGIGNPNAVVQTPAFVNNNLAQAPLEDGEYFRRIRMYSEGTLYENGEYRCIVALENVQYGAVGLDEFWWAAKEVPLLGTVRVGHIHPPMGLEGDMTGSSRCMTFMERSAYSEAIELNQNFTTGLWAGDNYFDQHFTWAAMLFRADRAAASGDYFGDGQDGAQIRLTALPIYKDEGRELLHLGMMLGWRDGQQSGPLATNGVSLSARPEMRDDDPAGSATIYAPNSLLANQTVPGANSNRMIDTGTINTNAEYLMGLETLGIYGPFSVQAEYGWNWVDNATTSASATPTSYQFDGGYVQLAYTLTGENRAYDRRFGTLARQYYGKEGPYSKAYLTRSGDGNWLASYGAWEIAARMGYVNLNSGVGPQQIAGGDMQTLTLGLNWYLNNNMNVMFDYINDYRYNLPLASGSYLGANAGSVQGFGVSCQFQY